MQPVKMLAFKTSGRFRGPDLQAAFTYLTLAPKPSLKPFRLQENHSLQIVDVIGAGDRGRTGTSL